MLIAENTSDVTAAEGTEDESRKCKIAKQSRHIRAKRNYSSSEESGFDFGSQKVTKLPPFPQSPDTLYAKEKEHIPTQKVVSPLPSYSKEILQTVNTEKHRISTVSKDLPADYGM